jgi:hypothetical protein
MKESTVTTGTPKPADTVKPAKPAAKQKWEKPKLEDVSEQVMAQPYIRFT